MTSVPTLLADFTPSELQSISELRARLSDVSKAEGNSIGKTYLAEDSTVWRYVLAKSQDPDPLGEAEAMFRRSVQWREDIGLAALCEEWAGAFSSQRNADTDTDNVAETPHREWSSARARMGMACFYGGIMKEVSTSGGPVLVERMGRVDLPGLYNDPYAFDCVAKTYIIYLETAWNLVRAAQGKVRGVITIDIAGAGLGMLGYVSVVKKIANAGVLMYPEINERVTIVNAGWFMSSLWAAVKPFLPLRTEGKIKIMNTDYQDAIQSGISGGAPSLPDFLGGGLGEQSHGVSPALSVDDAYGSIVAAICSDGVSYPDSDEFLRAALRHAAAQSSSSHVDRANLIENYFKNKIDHHP